PRLGRHALADGNERRVDRPSRPAGHARWLPGGAAPPLAAGGRMRGPHSAWRKRRPDGAAVATAAANRPSGPGQRRAADVSRISARADFGLEPGGLESPFKSRWDAPGGGSRGLLEPGATADLSPGIRAAVSQPDARCVSGAREVH